MIKKEKFLLLLIFCLCFYLLYILLFVQKSEKRLCNKNYKCPDCNVILISVDALRADRLGCYGYERNTSPNIDKIANEGILFENHISQAPWTVPSHSSMFTSLYPYPYGLKNPIMLDESFTTLAEVLKENNYTTVAFTEGNFMSAEFGFNQGFDIFNESGGGLVKVNGMISEWLNRSSRRPFFLFIHTYDTHCLSMDKPPEPYRSMYDKDFEENITYCGHEQDLTTKSERELFHQNAVYDGAVNYVDKLLGDLFEEFKEHNIYDKSIIIITSDHGDEIGDHGLFDHGHSLYNELIHVPLIIKYTNSKEACNRRFESISRAVDIMPTILDFLNISFKDKMEGRSLSPKILDPKFNPQQSAISIGYFNPPHKNKNLIAIRDEGVIISFSEIREINLIYEGMGGYGQEFTCGDKKYFMEVLSQKNIVNETMKKIEFTLNSVNCFNTSDEVTRSKNKIFSVDNISFLYDPHFKIIYDHLYSIRENNWKLIISKNNPPELYNIKNDPKEKENLIEKEKNIAERLTKKLHEFIRSKKIEDETENLIISEETLKKLKELGYIIE